MTPTPSFAMNWIETWDQFKVTGDLLILNGFVLDIFTEHLNGNLASADIIHQILQESEYQASVQSTIMDVLWLLDLEAEGSSTMLSSIPSSPSSSTSNIPTISGHVKLAKDLYEMGFIDLALALERLEAGLLEAMGIVASADLFNKKIIRLNTTAFYRQQKFNLLREESEGFARLLIMLAESDKLDPQVVFERVNVMIGTFDLDPIRVLDLVLDEFTFHPVEQLYIPLLLLLSFPASTVISLIGFKLEFASSADGKKFGSDYFDSLFQMIASLLNAGLIELSALYPRLLPSDEECVAELQTFNSELVKAASRLGVVNLAGAGDKSSTTQVDPVAKSLEPDSLSEHFATDAFSSKLAELFPDRNQKVYLVVGLLESGNIKSAQIILESLPCLVSLSHRIPQLISNHPSLHHLLQPGHLAYNLPLFSKICRSKPSKEVITSSLLPALSLSGNNALLFSQELWSAIKDLPYPERYSLYGHWSSVDSPLFMFAKASATAEAKKVIRRLAKETVRQYGRLVAKVTHASPCTTLPLILGQLQVYDNLIPSVVDAFRFLTPLSFDVLMWCLLTAMSSCERDRLKEDGVNVADWLQNLARFSASLIRKHYSSVDPAPLLRFVYAQLCDDNGLDVIILQEILTLVAGIEKPENDSEALLEAQFGGPLLISTIQESAQVASRPPRKAFSLIKSALKSEGLAKPLLIALAQAVDAAVYRMDYEHLKLVGSLVDVLHSTLCQFVRFLKTAEVAIDTSFNNLTNDYKLTKSISLFLLRGLGLNFTVEGMEFATFLETFWSMEAIRIPKHRYELEIGKVTNSELKGKLEAELTGLIASRSDYLQSTASTLLPSLNVCTDRNEIIDLVVNSAIFPRLIQTPVDAVFCADFIFFCHESGIEHFSTLALFDSIFELPSRILSSLTESESNCFGRFLQECLLRLEMWRNNQTLYEAEAIAYPRIGFIKRRSVLINSESNESEIENANSVNSAAEEEEEGELNEEGEFKAESKETIESTSIDSATKESPQLSWQDFRHVCFKWHEKLHKAISSALTSADFTAIRNAIIFSSRLQGTFPRLEKQSRVLEKDILALKENDTREDVKVLATRYSALLIQNRTSLLKEHHFHECEPECETEVLTSKTESISLKRSASEMEIDTPSQSKKTRHEDNRKSTSRDSRNDGRSDSRDSRNRDNRDSRDDRVFRDSRESRDVRDPREARSSRDTRDPRDSRNIRDPRESRDTRGSKISRDTRESRDLRDNRDTRDTRADSRDSQDTRDTRDTRDSRDSRDTRDSRESRSSHRSRRI